MRRGYKRKFAVREDGVLQRGRILKKKASKISTDPTPFFKSLLNPLGSLSAGRVPDLAVYPSSTAVIEFEYSQSSFAVGSPSAVGYAGGALHLSSNGATYMVEGDTTTDTTFAFASQTVSGSDTWSGNSALGNVLLPGCNNLQGFTDALRIVGAGINVEFIGNDSNNEGVIVSSYLTSPSCEHNAQYTFVNLSAMQNSKYNYNGAAKKGTSIAWMPVDTLDLTYGRAAQPTTITSYRLDSNQARNYGTLQWHASGLNTSAPPKFRVTIRVHYECIQSADVYSTRNDEGVTVAPEALTTAFATAAEHNGPGPAHDSMSLVRKMDFIHRVLGGLRKVAVAASAAAIGTTAYRMALPYDKYGYA